MSYANGMWRNENCKGTTYGLLSLAGTCLPGSFFKKNLDKKKVISPKRGDTGRFRKRIVSKTDFSYEA